MAGLLLLAAWVGQVPVFRGNLAAGERYVAPWLVAGEWLDEREFYLLTQAAFDACAYAWTVALVALPLCAWLDMPLLSLLFWVGGGVVQLLVTSYTDPEMGALDGGLLVVFAIGCVAFSLVDRRRLRAGLAPPPGRSDGAPEPGP